MTAAASAAGRASLAERRLAEARRLADAQQAVLRADAEAEQLRSVADQDAGVAVERAAERDAAAVSLALAWRRWAADARTRELFGEIDWAAHPAVRPLLLDAEALTEPAEGALRGVDDTAVGSCPAGAGHD